MRNLAHPPTPLILPHTPSLPVLLLLQGPPHMLPSSAAATSLCRALRPAHIQGAAYATSSDSNSSTNTIDSHDRDAVGPSSSLLAGAADAAQDAAAAKAAASADVTNAQATPAMDTASFQVELKGHQREMGGDSLLPDGEQHPADPYAAEQQAAPRPDDYHEEGDGAVGPSSSFPA